MKAKRKEYRALNVSHRETKDLVNTLTSNGIESNTYRINHFSTQKELVAEISIFKKIKSIID